jgi:hypothetical protein
MVNVASFVGCSVVASHDLGGPSMVSRSIGMIPEYPLGQKACLGLRSKGNLQINDASWLRDFPELL